MANSNKETFVIYNGGLTLQLNWLALPSPPHSPALRLCVVNSQLLLLLTADECLYVGRYSISNFMLHLEIVRSDILDVGFCRDTRELFIVTTAGTVLMQRMSADFCYNPSAWQPVTFDPLEISEDGILVQRVCCSAEGVIFITRTNETYVMGSCGEIFSAERQPKHLRLFEENREVLDMVAGDEFYVMLLKSSYNDKEDPLDLLGKNKQNEAGPSSHSLSSRVQQHNRLDIDISGEDMDKKQELNSNTSMRSFSTKSSHSYSDQDSEAYLQQIIKEGFALLNTDVFTFGAANNGVLGTGDHIKRTCVNKTKLQSVGVCSISAGREHTICRTVDGRLYHWGLNSRHQLSDKKSVVDLSTPTELRLDKAELTVQQRSIMRACCGDYQTVLLNARGELHEKGKQLIAFNNDFFALHMVVPSKKWCPLLLASDNYTVYNWRNFQRQYHSCYHNLQMQLQLMLKYKHAIRTLQAFEQKCSAKAIKQLKPICQSFEKCLYMLASLLSSFEGFYRGDIDNPADLLFVKFYRECIELFEEYSKAYCDLYAVDGFLEASKVFAHFCSARLFPDSHEEMDMKRFFQQPFQIFPNFVQFLEQLSKSRNEFAEHLLAWQSFARQNRIDMELADATLDFWQHNERNIKVSQFRHKSRRVILTSARIPLKLSNNGISMSTPTFILFSDFLCQTGGQIQTFPLVAMWIKIETNTVLRITTPEKSFTLTARTHDDKMLWYDQLESSILAALARPQGTKISNSRITGYVYSRTHPQYAGVHAYGRWCNGVLHGNCYLDYPDGKFYIGEIRYGKIEGFGKMVVPAVGLYEGNFKAGKFHGHGVYEMKENEVYEGHFRDGLFHGHGMLRNNNYTYVGEYQANVKCGYGIMDDMIKGDKYMGMFSDNKRDGPGVCITVNGDYFEGHFSNDEIANNGLAVFHNNYYYEGELSMNGPNGNGTYYMPHLKSLTEDSDVVDIDEFLNRQITGNVLFGQLGGNWQEVRANLGGMSINVEFTKYPKTIGKFIVNDARKWCALFANFEEEILGDSTPATGNVVNVTKHLWSRIAVYMTTLRDREKTMEQQDAAYQSTRSYFAKNISASFSSSFDKISLRSTHSALPASRSNILDISDSGRTHSQETLFDLSGDFDLMSTGHYPYQRNEESSFNSFNNSLNAQFESWHNDSTTSTRSSFDSGNCHNSNMSQNGLEFVPSFGIMSLTEEDILALREYLTQAFKDRLHPLYVLNQRISNCFYNSYGCWKVKPTAILAKQAMSEWESITKRVYEFVRKMFPALPEDYCIMESAREVISHITLLYPIILSEGVYSTLFVLYANKYSRKDEVYRQNLLNAEKMSNNELAEILGLESSVLPVVATPLFLTAMQTFKQLQEKYSPKAMLTVIETCMQQITDAYKAIRTDPPVILSGDGMLPLTVFLVLRASVPHLGAELALLDDLTSGPHFQYETNGIVGYFYTTLKAAYVHVTTKPISKT